jgi:hypothetical protein
MKEIRKAIEEKIKELEWKNNLRSLEIIDWLKNELLPKLPEEKKEEVVKEVKVEIPEEKPAKRKISFSKKK